MRAKTKKPARAVKYVVWLSNMTSHKDDEWFTTFAKTPDEAKANAEKVYDKTRFFLGHIDTVKEFRRIRGKDFPLGRKCNRQPG